MGRLEGEGGVIERDREKLDEPAVTMLLTMRSV